MLSSCHNPLWCSPCTQYTFEMVKVSSHFFLHVMEHQQRTYKSIKVKTFKMALFRSILTHTNHTSFKPWKHGEQHLEGCYEKYENAEKFARVNHLAVYHHCKKGLLHWTSSVSQFKFAGKFAPCRTGWRQRFCSFGCILQRWRSYCHFFTWGQRAGMWISLTLK